MPDGYVTPSTDGSGKNPPKSPQEIDHFRGNFLEMLLREVVKAVNGVFVHGIGGAFEQLSSWASDLWNAAETAANMLRRLLTRIGASAGDAIEDAVDWAGDAIKGTALTLAGLTQNLWSNAAAVIGAIPQTLVTGLTGAIQAINLAVRAAENFIQGVIDAIMSGLRGIPIIGALIPDLRKGIARQKTDQQSFTISAIVSDARNPQWVCRYPISDVTYPEAYNNHLQVFGDTGDATAGTSHTHKMDGGISAPAGWSVNQHESRGSYLTVANTTVHDTIGVIAWKDAGTINNVYLELFKENDNGSLTRIYSREFSGDLTTETAYYEFTLPSRLVVSSGERYLARLRNSSTVNTTARIIGITRVVSAPEDGFKTVGSTLTALTSYTSGQAADARADGSTLNWFMLAAKSMPEVDRLFSDNATRSAIGGMWVRQSTNAGLIDVYEEAFGYTGTDDGDQAALYIHRCTRDVNKVEASLVINANSTARCGVMLHCSRDFTQVVYLAVNNTSAKIYSGPIDSLTERASLNVGGSGTWSLYYNQTDDKYTALKDGSTVGLEWTSVGSAVEHGSNYRYGGFRISFASGEPAGTVDDWQLRDWYVAVPAVVNVGRMEATADMFIVDPSAAVVIAAVRMESTAAMPDPSLEVAVAASVPRMGATTSMGNADVSNNSSLPYILDFTLA
jgi:hypothetical protein